MPLSDEQRKAASERMKAMHERKKAEKQQPTPELPDVDNDTNDVVDQASPDRISRLEAQIELLLKMQQGQSQTVTDAPKRTVEKYTLDLSGYASPVPKLMEWATQDRRMKQVAFTDNYELQYVPETPPRYQLADGSWERQPKFTLGLLEYAYDDDGNPQVTTNSKNEEVQIKYLRKRLVFFEDPDLALSIAHRRGIELDDQTSQQFLNDMKFIQAQEWIAEYFYPPKPTRVNGPREEAIAGQMVTIVESPTDLSKIDPSSKLKV